MPSPPTESPPVPSTPPLLTDTFPFTWSEHIDKQEDTTATTPTSAIQQRLHDGAFGEMRSVPVDPYRTRPQRATFVLDDATVFTNLACEWKERLDALTRANRALTQQRKMAMRVQRELTVQLLHQLRRTWMVDSREAERVAKMTLWARGAERLGARDTETRRSPPHRRPNRRPPTFS